MYILSIYTKLDKYCELPTCPLCIEKLDGSITGISYETISKPIVYDSARRWEFSK